MIVAEKDLGWNRNIITGVEVIGGQRTAEKDITIYVACDTPFGVIPVGGCPQLLGTSASRGGSQAPVRSLRTHISGSRPSSFMQHYFGLPAACKLMHAQKNKITVKVIAWEARS